MRLRACHILLLLGLGGCAHLPEGVKIDLENGMIEVGPCRCKLPRSTAPVPGPTPPPTPAPTLPSDDGPQR